MTLKHILAAALAAVASKGAVAAPPAPSFDRAAWKADLARIEAGLAQGYANLDWQVDRRGLNLARADEQIKAMLDRADSDVEAALVIVKLVDAFKDPHLQLQIGPPPEYATLLPRSSSDQGPLAASDTCSASRFRAGKAATRLPYPSASGWKQLSEAPFQTGTIGDIGIVRIPSFDEQRYLEACNMVGRPGMDGRQLQLATRAELNRQLESLIVQLRANGMKKLVIDLSGNGGGSEWSSEVAAMLSAKPLTRVAPRMAGPTCDRSTMWKGERPCPIYARAPETETIQGRGVWVGPLAILTDRSTASAAEELVTWLKDNGRAVTAGQRTFGAGCGYVDGGSAIALQAARLHIMVPNCSRYTAAGINEIEGIEPMVAVDWGMLSADKVPATLQGLFSR